MRAPARAGVTWVMTMRPLWWRLNSSGAAPPAWPAAFCITMRAMPASRRSAGSRAGAAPCWRLATAAGGGPRLPPLRPSLAALLPALRLPTGGGTVVTRGAFSALPLTAVTKSTPWQWQSRPKLGPNTQQSTSPTGKTPQTAIHRQSCAAAAREAGRWNRGTVETVEENLRRCVPQGERRPVRGRCRRSRTRRWRPRPPGDRSCLLSCAMPPRPHPGHPAHPRTPPPPSVTIQGSAAAAQGEASLLCVLRCCVLYAVITGLWSPAGVGLSEQC